MSITIHSSCSFLGKIGRRWSDTLSLVNQKVWRWWWHAKACDRGRKKRMLSNISGQHHWSPCDCQVWWAYAAGPLSPWQLCSCPLLLNVSPNPLLPAPLTMPTSQCSTAFRTLISHSSLEMKVQLSLSRTSISSPSTHSQWPISSNSVTWYSS